MTDAVRFVEEAKQNPFRINGRTVYADFSDKETLSNAVDVPAFDSSRQTTLETDDNSDKRVVLLTCHNCRRRPWPDDIFRVFRPYGVERIALCKRVSEDKQLALIEFSSHDGAYSAFREVDGRDTLDYRCELQWSKMSELKFDKLDDTKKDYSGQILEDPLLDAQPEPSYTGLTDYRDSHSIVPSDLFLVCDDSMGFGRRVLLLTCVCAKSRVHPDDLYRVFAYFGCERVILISKSVEDTPQALIQFATSPGAMVAKALHGLDVGGFICDLKWSALSNSDLDGLNLSSKRDYTPSPTTVPPYFLSAMSSLQQQPLLDHRPMSREVTMSDSLPRSHDDPNESNGRVIFVAGISETHTTPIGLYALFGGYGDIKIVKILFKQRDCALIEYAKREQAQCARQMLDGVILHGRVLKITSAKANEVHQDKSGPELCCTAETAGKSPYNPKSVNPPNRTLHVYNIPSGTSERELEHLFEPYGAVKDVEFFKSTRQMAYVTMDSQESAVLALIGLFSSGASSNRAMRVSFSSKVKGSKSTLSDRSAPY